MSLLNQFLTHINSQQPLTYIDIGAMGGISSYWQKLEKNCQVIAFEPDEREFTKLQSRPGLRYFPYALYHSSQELKFYVSTDSGKSSIYPPNMVFLEDFPDHQRYATAKEIIFPKEKVRTLDQVLLEAKIQDTDFIKIDTQGSELDILKGAKQSLAQMFGLELEVEFVPLYQGQPLFRDVDAYLDAEGFQLMDLRRCWWKRKSHYTYIGRGQLIFGDAIYMRRADVFLNMLMSQDNRSLAINKIRKAVIICMIYRYPDYAIGLLDQALARKLIDSTQHQEWILLIQKETRSWGMPKIWGRSLLAKIFNRVAEIVRPASHLGWSDGDRFIGNIRNI